jgi:putative ABC transport system permease protein
MSWTRFFRRKHWDEERARELDAYLDAETDENIARGMSVEEARYAAHRKLGNTTLIREEIYHMNSLGWLDTLWQDVRYGVRQLHKNPGFTAAAVITLALGIGANTSIFSVVWRPLRYHQPQRLLIVWETRPDGGRSPVSAPTYLDWRNQNTCFEQLAASRSVSFSLSGNPPVLVSGVSISPNFFETFRLRAERGRFFSPGEFRPGGPKVAVLSHEIWQTHFGGEPAVVGTTIRLNSEPYLVVGVAPADFEFLGTVDVWVPLTLPDANNNREARNLLVVGRMKPGVTSAETQAEMRTLAARTALAFPATNQQWSALAESIQEALAGRGVALMLILLFATVSVVLLMSCANVTNLLLAKATTRQKEVAVRIALGASRWRVMRQLLLETSLLAMLGGALGMLLAWASVRYLSTLPVLQAPGLAPIEINRAVLEFALGLCLATTLLSGFVPAWRTTAAKLLEHIKSSGPTALGERGESRLRNSLVTGGLALSLTLMVAAGLSLHSFIRLTRVDPGFPPNNLLTAHLTLPAPQYPDSNRIRAFYSELLGRVRALPGIQDAAISTSLPPTSLGGGQPFRLEGRDPTLHGSSEIADVEVISPDYFSTLGLTVRKGRTFTGDDREGSPPVVIINQRLAEMFFSAHDPLGARLVISKSPASDTNPSRPVAMEIVGVVNNIKNSRLSEPSSPAVFMSYLQAPRSSEYLVVRSPGAVGPLLAALRSALGAVDPDLPLTSASTMDERLSRSLAGGRVVTTMMLVFALMALAMGNVGLYGVIAYSVTQRTSEFALRMALGASRRDILELVAKETLRLLALGGVIGLALALAVAHSLRGAIYGISPYDPLTFATVGLILLAVILIASYVPARRAISVDPMMALRYE